MDAFRAIPLLPQNWDRFDTHLCTTPLFTQMMPALLCFFKRASLHTFHLCVSWLSNHFSNNSYLLNRKLFSWCCPIFVLWYWNIFTHCQNLYEIEGERLCCQFITQISVIKLQLPQHWSLQLCSSPLCANLDIFHIYIRNIRFLSTGSLFCLQNCPKSQAVRSQPVRFLAF